MFTFKRPDRFCRRTKFNVSGRPERRARERKRAAASCRPLDSFLPPTKRNSSTSDSAHSIPAASIYLTGSDCQSGRVGRCSQYVYTSVADPEPGSQLKQVRPPYALSEEDTSTVFSGV